MKRWNNARGSQLASQLETWTDIVDYNVSMYEGIFDPALQLGIDSRWAVDFENCYIAPGTVKLIQSIHTNIHSY